MDEKNRLTLYMGIFYLLVILCIGLIVIDEKKKDFLIPKIEDKINTYINNNYSDIKSELKLSKVKRYGDKYIMKLSNKKNKDLYFEITYNKNKVSDTYKKDYVEGQTLNKNIELYLNNLLKEKEKDNKNNFDTYKIIYNTKLTNCTKYVKNNLLRGNYLLPIYTIYVETDIDSDIKTTLTNVNKYTKKIGFNPKNYHIIINNSQNISKSIDIVIATDIIENNIDDVIKLIDDNNFSELKKYNIKCKYLN